MKAKKQTKKAPKIYRPQDHIAHILSRCASGKAVKVNGITI